MKPSLIILGLIFLFSCKKEDKPYKPVQVCKEITNNKDSIIKYFYGNWNWLEEKRFNSFLNEVEYLTPKTEGFTLLLKLKADTASFYKNGVIDSVYAFKITEEKDFSNVPTDNIPVIAFFDLSTKSQLQYYVPVKICSDYLLFQYNLVSSLGGSAIWERR